MLKNIHDCVFSGRKEEPEGASAGDTGSDADSPEFDRLLGQSVREGEESLQLHDPLSELPGNNPGDSRSYRALLHSCPVSDPRLGSQ